MERGKVATATEWAAAVLYNGLGRSEEALAAAKRGAANPQELGLSIWAMVELVEAAARLGRPGEAIDAVRHINELARASGTDWALGTAASVSAQVSEAESAETLYQERSAGSSAPRSGC